MDGQTDRWMDGSLDLTDWTGLLVGRPAGGIKQPD